MSTLTAKGLTERVPSSIEDGEEEECRQGDEDEDAVALEAAILDREDAQVGRNYQGKWKAEGRVEDVMPVRDAME